jgi:Uma2 family endonuclease
MTWEHSDRAFELAVQLRNQLDRQLFRVGHNAGRLRRQDATYYIPDVFVIATSYGDGLRGRQDVLEVHGGPALLVAEVWSPSTGYYDVDSKLPEYQRRGDLETRRLHPYDRTLIVWRRQDDGTYETFQQTGGTIQPFALPGVTIDLDALFD